MLPKPLPLLLVCALLLSQIPMAYGQQASSNDWTAVQQLKTNTKLTIKQKNGNDLKGRMIEATDTTITIDRDGKPVSIARTDIRQIYVSSGQAEKVKWTAIGAGIGAGAGGGIGGLKYRSDRDDYIIYPVMGVLIGTGVGAVSGLVFGQSRRKRELVYDAR